MGMSNAQNLVAGGQNIVALADVDMRRVLSDVAGRAQNRDGTVNEVGAKLKAAYESANHYSDFRRMLEQEGDAIDAVVIATPIAPLDTNGSFDNPASRSALSAAYTESCWSSCTAVPAWPTGY